MRVGIFADTHDHLPNIRLAVQEFNHLTCELVVFAGDLVSTIAIPPLRRLNCPMIACFGDNEGNKTGVRGGMEVVGEIAEPPICFQLTDGTRFLVTHQRELVRGLTDGCQVVIYAHTHRAVIHRDGSDRLLINPGEASGWSFGTPTVAFLETSPMSARLIRLDASDVAGRSM